jgi:hypothetical protein
MNKCKAVNIQCAILRHYLPTISSFQIDIIDKKHIIDDDVKFFILYFSNIR